MENPRLLPDDPLSDDEEWKKLLSSIDTLTVPIDLLKKVVVYHEDGTAQDIDLTKYNETYLLSYLDMYEDDIAAIDYIVNFEKLKSTVRKSTKKTLRNL